MRAKHRLSAKSSHGTTKGNPVSYTHLDVYKRQVDINNHIPRQATPKNQLVVLIAQNIAFMPFDGIKNVFRRNATQAHRSAAVSYTHLQASFPTLRFAG